jgi:hypothetical protein
MILPFTQKRLQAPNGLIRQYIPKKSCMKSISQADCDGIALKLNTRPRKRLGFKTPYEVYYQEGSPLHFGLELKYLLFLFFLLSSFFFLIYSSISFG